MTVDQLVERLGDVLGRYHREHRTDLLRDAAPLVADLRAQHTLADGRTDWSGRSAGYRDAIGKAYARAGIPRDEQDRVQSALRFHVGQAVRQRASLVELAQVGLGGETPPERLRRARDSRAQVVAEARVAARRVTAWLDGTDGHLNPDDVRALLRLV
jgi:hypothetical protein